MSQELVYTSSPQGLKPGAHGFCTVAHSRGMSANLMQQLESLSGYRHLYPPQDPQAALNPVAFSHLVVTIAGRRCHVLSRICDAGLDYSQRTNKFAHHVVLDAAEVPAAGPAALLAHDGFMRSKWESEPGIVPTGPVVPLGDLPPRVCRAWQKLTGDAGWGGVLAETATGAANRQVVLIFRPGMDILPLLVESLALLPVKHRWRVSFSTYFTNLPAGIICQWRCVVDGTPEAAAARKASKGELVLDLCRSLGRAPGGVYVDAARTGKVPVAKIAIPEPADVELEYALQEPIELPVSAGIGVQPPLETNVAEYPVVRPPSTSFVQPPRVQQLHFQRKPPPRWPWVLGIAATILILIASVVAVWFISRNIPPSSESKVIEASKSSSGKNDTEPGAPARTTEKRDNEATKATEGEKNESEGAKSDEKKKIVDSNTKNPEDKKSEDEAEKEKKNREEKKKADNPAAINTADPLCDLRDKPVTIPKCKALDLRDSNSKQPPFLIGLIHNEFDNRSKIENIEIIGWNQVFPEYALNPGQPSSKDTWSYAWLRKKNLAASPITIFRVFIAEGKVMFQWENVVNGKEKADLLRNCLLKITMSDGHSAFVKLRAPIKIASLSFDMLKGTGNRVLTENIEGPPQDIPIELGSLSLASSQGAQRPEIQILSNAPLKFTLGKEIPLHFEVVIHRLSDKNENKFQVELMYLGAMLDNSDQWPNLSPKQQGQPTLLYLKDITANRKNREDKQKKLEQELDAVAKAEQSDKKRQDELQKQIDEIATHIKKVEELESTYKLLQNSCKLKCRAFMTIDDEKIKHEVDLVEVGGNVSVQGKGSTPDN